jgi:hypothetical protein
MIYNLIKQFQDNGQYNNEEIKYFLYNYSIGTASPSNQRETPDLTDFSRRPLPRSTVSMPHN